MGRVTATPLAGEESAAAAGEDEGAEVAASEVEDSGGSEVEGEVIMMTSEHRGDSGASCSESSCSDASASEDWSPPPLPRGAASSTPLARLVGMLMHKLDVQDLLMLVHYLGRLLFGGAQAGADDERVLLYAALSMNRIRREEIDSEAPDRRAPNFVFTLLEAFGRGRMASNTLWTDSIFHGTKIFCGASRLRAKGDPRGGLWGRSLDSIRCLSAPSTARSPALPRRRVPLPRQVHL